MVRPKRIRRIFFKPEVTYFKPAGVPLVNLNESSISYDELEVLRLIDLEGVDQKKAGVNMKISQPTLSRLLKDARKKVAGALIQGNAIRIQGGNFKMAEDNQGGFGRGRMSSSRQGGRGFGRGPLAAGPGGVCGSGARSAVPSCAGQRWPHRSCPGSGASDAAPGACV